LAFSLLDASYRAQLVGCRSTAHRFGEDSTHSRNGIVWRRAQDQMIAAILR
jgi:hypothetical protein